MGRTGEGGGPDGARADLSAALPLPAHHSSAFILTPFFFHRCLASTNLPVILFYCCICILLFPSSALKNASGSQFSFFSILSITVILGNVNVHMEEPTSTLGLNSLHSTAPKTSAPAALGQLSTTALLWALLPLHLGRMSGSPRATDLFARLLHSRSPTTGARHPIQATIPSTPFPHTPPAS